MKALEHIKLAAMNLLAWTGSIISINIALPYIQAIGLLFSILVSIASLVLIMKKIRVVDKK